MNLPFPKNRSYKIIQGYNGSYSHNTDFSRYAIDFSLKIKDTVCSAADGYIVGVIKDFEFAGTTTDWIDYNNYITIYHPESVLLPDKKEGLVSTAGEFEEGYKGAELSENTTVIK